MAMAGVPSRLTSAGSAVRVLGGFSPDEIESFTTISKIVEFLQIPEPIASPFYSAMGALPETMPRALGVIELDELKGILADLKVPNLFGEGEEPTSRTLTVVERGSLILLCKACRHCAGMDLPPPVVPAPALVGSPAAFSVPSPGVRKIKLSHVLSQGDDTECEVASETLMAAGFGRWESIFGIGTRPSPDADCTLEQLSAVDFLFKSGAVPYVDYAIWGPHGHRMARKMRLGGQILDANATFRFVEVAGPPNIDVWALAFDVMMTSFLYLNIVDLGILQQYKRKILMYHTRYGPACWLLLYQAETRFRSEQLERQRRTTLAAYNAAILAGGNTPYEPSRPWNQTWLDGMKDSDWWQLEFVEIAQLYLMRFGKLDQFVGGDAPVAAENSGSSNDVVQLDQGHRQPKRTITAPNNDRPTKVKRPITRDLPAKVEGHFKTNRSGIKLCEAFQSGACGKATHGNRCPSNREMVHQCGFCLTHEHGSKFCGSPNTEGLYYAPPKGKGSKGKGKGKGGRKGKKNQW